MHLLTLEFTAPDNLPGRTPYACSYHWFRGPDGRVISLDVIRSSDTGSLGLRAVRERADGGIDGFARILPESAWAPFITDGATFPAGDRPVMSRGKNFVAGHAEDGEGTLGRVRFEIHLDVQRPGVGPGSLGLDLSCLSVADFTRVRYRGWVEIDGERLVIDSPGTVSIHYGDRLPRYAYLIAVPALDEHAPRLLAGSVNADADRFHGALLGDKCLVYGYGSGPVPPISIYFGAFGRDLPLGHAGRVEIEDVRPFRHDLLGEPTVTATVKARLVPPSGPPIDLGTTFIDYRGRPYVDALGLAPAAG